MTYKQLTQEQRYQIQALLKANHNQTQIAMILQCHKSTISREIRRNTGLRGYRPAQVQRLADKRRQSKYRSHISNDTLACREIVDWTGVQSKSICGSKHSVASVSVTNGFTNIFFQDKIKPMGADPSASTLPETTS